MDKFVEENIKKLVSRDSYNSQYPENVIPENKVTKENIEIFLLQHNATKVKSRLDWIINKCIEIIKDLIKKNFNKNTNSEFIKWFADNAINEILTVSLWSITPGNSSFPHIQTIIENENIMFIKLNESKQYVFSINNVDMSDIDLHLDYMLSDNEFDYIKETCLKKLFNKYGQYGNKIN